MPQELLPYNTQTNRYAKQTKVPVAALCNGFTVRNTGDTICTVNGEPIPPMGFKAFGGVTFGIYVGRIDIGFTTQGQATPGTVSECYVTQLFFTKGRGYDPIFL